MQFTDSIEGFPVKQLAELLNLVTFRPGLRMEVHMKQWHCSMSNRVDTRYYNDPCLHYMITVPNTYHPEDTADLHMHQGLPTFVKTVEDFYDHCMAIALWFDQHEGREWFKFDGKPWRDPHMPSEYFDPRIEFDKVRAIRSTLHTPARRVYVGNLDSKIDSAAIVSDPTRVARGGFIPAGFAGEDGVGFASGGS